MDLEPSSYALARGAELTRSPLALARAVRLGAPPEAVFAWITDFPRLPEWMPLIKRCTVDDTRAVTPGGVGAVRVIEALAGGPTLEAVVALERPTLLAYSASDASLMGMYTGHLSVLTCEPHARGGTWLSWLSYGVPGRPPAGWVGPATFRFVIRRSLANLGRLFP